MNSVPAQAATFNQSDGTHTVDSLILGTGSGDHDTYNLSGTGILEVGRYEHIGGLGPGTFTQTGGTNRVGYDLFLGNTNSGPGTYQLSGTGSLEVGRNEYIGYSGTSTFTQSGGIHTVNGTLFIGRGSSGSGTYTLTGGTLTVNGGIINNAGGTFHAGPGTTATVGGVGFINHGRLNGAGTIVGNITSDGIIAPGNSPGTLTITGDYTQSALGTLETEIGGLLAGTEYDVLNVTGTATLNGTLTVSLFDLGSGVFAPVAGNSFDILTAQIIRGTFRTVNLPALTSGLVWQIHYLTDAIGSTDVVRLSVQPVPLPAAAYLFGAALVGLAGLTRRRG